MSECFARATSKVAAMANQETVKLFTAVAYQATDSKAAELTVILKTLSTAKLFTRYNYNRRCFTVGYVYKLQTSGFLTAVLPKIQIFWNGVLCHWMSGSSL